MLPSPPSCSFLSPSLPPSLGRAHSLTHLTFHHRRAQAKKMRCAHERGSGMERDGAPPPKMVVAFLPSFLPSFLKKVSFPAELVSPLPPSLLAIQPYLQVLTRKVSFPHPISSSLRLCLRDPAKLPLALAAKRVCSFTSPRCFERLKKPRRSLPLSRDCVQLNFRDGHLVDNDI